MSSDQPKLAVVPKPAAPSPSCFTSASFWFPERLVASDWLEHAPFAFWLIESLVPRTVVELGTQSGFSYSTFCQAILNLRIGARAFAVDTWAQGPDGASGEDIWTEFKRYHDERYGSFSQLLRARFEDALDYFDAGSIDLLHVDGPHSYEDVRADFTSWKPKLSDRAVVLFHGTNVHEREFGIFRFWNELRGDYPSFEFVHGNGLGVLAFGSNAPETVAALFSSANNRKTEELVRSGYSRLGAAVKERLQAQEGLGEAERLRVAMLSDLQAKNAGIVQGERLLAEQRQKFLGVEQALQEARNRLTEQANTIQELDQRAQRGVAERDILRDQLIKLEARKRELEAQNLDTTALQEDLASQSDNFQLRQQELETQLGRVEAEKNAIEARTLVLEAQRQALESQNLELDSEKIALEIKNRELEARTEDLEAHRKVLETLAQALEIQNRELVQQKQSTAQDIEEQRKLLLSRDAELENRSGELAAARRRSDEVANALQDAIQREEHFGRELRLAKTELNDAYAEFDAAIEDVAELALKQGKESSEYKWQRDMALASLSWRATRPFRSAIFQWFYGPMRSSWAAISGVTPPQLRLMREADVAIPSVIRAWRRRSSVRSHPRRAGGSVRIAFLSGEWETPGHTYRIKRAAAVASLSGANVTTLTMATLEQNFEALAECQLLFVWRAAWTESLEKAFAVVRANGGTVIYDLDDLMIEPELAQPKYVDGIRSQRMDVREIAGLYQSILQAFARADFGVAPTEFLARRMRIKGKAAFVLPNGFDIKTLAASRESVRHRRSITSDGLLRIGYAAGTRTHQHDFAQISDAVARILRERDDVRLVLFRDRAHRMVTLDEFPELASLSDRVEWRRKVDVSQLPGELARFDVNLAPLEAGNPYCEAKSELKYFESALVGVPTIASPTEPFRLAIRHGETGFIAASADEWYDAITRLLDDAELRASVGRNAFHDVLWRYGPERRLQLFASLMERSGGRQRAMLTEAGAAERKFSAPVIPKHTYLYHCDNQKPSIVTVIVPVYNYANYVIEALDSVYRQNMRDLDLIVIDDRSTDNSAALILKWLETHGERFNRALLIQNVENSGLAYVRNVGFANAETPFILPLDADNRLLPNCAQRCAEVLMDSTAGFAYPEIQQFGTHNWVMGRMDFDPALLVPSNFIDAMAMVRKSVWAGVGGYDPMLGWEDYDFWCKCVELGLEGKRVPEILAEYRVHESSMLATVTNLPAKKLAVIEEMERRHSWLRIHRPH